MSLQELPQAFDIPTELLDVATYLLQRGYTVRAKDENELRARRMFMPDTMLAVFMDQERAIYVGPVPGGYDSWFSALNTSEFFSSAERWEDILAERIEDR